MRRWLRAILNRGSDRLCPICNANCRRFRPTGVVVRHDAKCPTCNSLERHRLLWLFAARHTDLFQGKARRMLHVAPEPCLVQHFRRLLGDGYVTADLLDPRVDVRMDITQIPSTDQSFDVVYCSHVLEHVPDDRKAMREFHRVLRHDGWAVILVPITADKTVEDLSITDPKERLRLYGQEDHVRRYGPDFLDRLRESGFHVQTVTAPDLLSPPEILRMRVGGEIYFCKKQKV